MTVQLTHEKGGKIKESCQNVLKKSILSIREFSELIGKMVASEFGVPYAKLFHKRLHIAKNEQLRKHRGDYDAKFFLEEKCKEDLKRWVDNIEISKRQLCVENP
jgi:hypothetical protein